MKMQNGYLFDVRCADIPDFCMCSHCSRRKHSHLQRLFFESAAHLTRPDVQLDRFCLIENFPLAANISIHLVVEIRAICCA